MTRDDFVALAAMAAGSVLLPVLAATGLGWNTWLCVVLGAAGLVTTVLIGRRMAYQRHQEQLRAAMRQPPPMQPEPVPVEVPNYSSQVSTVPVPTNEADYHFMFSTTVRWTHLRHGSTADAEATARKVVLDRTCALTRVWPPNNPAFTQIQLAAELGIRRPDPAGVVEVWADTVSLNLTDEDRDRLAKLATIRKEKLVWEHERVFEVSKREYLGNDVLSTPGNAVVWKLAQDYSQIVKTVDLIPTLRALTAAANDHELPEPELTSQPSPEPLITEENAWYVEPEPPSTNGFHDGSATPTDPVEAFVSGVFGDEDSGQRDLFADQVATLVDKHRRTLPPQTQPEEPPADQDLHPADTVDDLPPDTPPTSPQEDLDDPQ
ncbi:hypothetical protein [Kutzneria buriramensis]|uniref:Uncharacterized protein n=1 Tax=Kutzneria buriramensis TaxID=1045776 RepID=A0A3E0HKR1_9PSEU|nr:hypothetical protein [Kutzneria buriramensis]REH47021.1 hypothetical protein BCF44_106185 [Kutzneria buriramensis]